MKKVLLGILIITLIAGGAYWFYMPREVEPVQVNNQQPQIVLADRDGLYVYPITKELFEQAKDGHIPVDLLSRYYVYGQYDEQNGILTVADRHNLLRIDTAYRNTTINDQAASFIEPVIIEEDALLSLNAYGERFNILYDVNEADRTVFVKWSEEPYPMGVVLEEASIVADPADPMTTYGMMTEGQHVIAGHTEDGYTQILTPGYTHGWIDSSKLQKPALSGELPAVEVPMKEPILMVWEAVYSAKTKTDAIGDMAGLNVVSPTWYALKDAAGNISSKADPDYLEWAKEQGYQVWALVSNDFDVDRTHAFLYDTTARQTFIDQILQEVTIYEYEGINIDFENVYMADRRALTQFVAELSAALRRQGVIISMDVTVMGGSENWSRCYNRRDLGHVVDYLAIMTYDEHWASSPKSGSVASYGWVKSGLEEIARVVPAEKLIMGVPFYMRMWKETPSESKANAMNVKSAAFGMETAQQVIEKRDLNLIWDEQARQYYAGWIEDGMVKKVWFEEARSLGEKASLYKELDLAGIAAWRRGFETSDIWPVLAEVIKK